MPADFGESAQVTESARADGRETAAPTVSSVSEQRSSVFSREGLGHAAGRAVAEVTCLCGGKAKISPDDYGSTVYCPSCGAEIEVGERLGQARSLPARASAPADDAAPSRNGPVAAAPRRGQEEPRISPVPIVAVVSGLVVAIVIAWLGAAYWPRAKSLDTDAWAGSDLLIVPPPTPQAEANEETVAEADVVPEEEPLPEIVGDPAESITMEMIEALLAKKDKQSALIDAQVWRQLLVERGVSAGDPRLPRLNEVIAKLLDDLTPKPPPPNPAIERFRKLLDRMHQILADEDLAAARKLIEEATEMFRANAEALAPFSRRLLLQQARLKQLEAQVEGLATVERLLATALRDAEAGRVLEALEARATALYLAKEGCVRTDEEERRLQTLATDLREPLRLARGKRAVEDAQRCQDAHDLAARNVQVQLARSLLPGLPESVVKPLLATVEQIAKRAIAGSHRTPLGQELEARTAYEEALEHYARGELPALVELAVQATHGETPEAGKLYREKLAGITFQALESRLSAVVAGLVPAAERGTALVALQQACDQLSAWKDDARYQALRAAIEQQTGEVAEKALAGAKRLAAKDQLADAVAMIVPATQLGPADARAAAEKLRGEWQAEVDLRASYPAQANHWRRIEALANSHEVVAAAREIRLFEQRYPKTPHQADLTALKARLLPDINREIDAVMALAEAAWNKEKWTEFMQHFQSLQPLIAAAGRERDFQAFGEKAAKLEARIEGRLEEARRATRMATDEEIIAVLNAARDVLSIHPDHAAAAELLKKARTQATVRAARLMKRADGLRRNKMVNETYRKLLTSVVDLDRDGEQGRRAQLALDATPEGRP